MKTVLTVSLVVVVALSAIAQGPPAGPGKPFDVNQVAQFPLINPPQRVAGGMAQRGSGNPGPRTFYYWVVTNTIIGSSTPAGPFPIATAPNVLNASNTVQITWTPDAQASSYDVLRTVSPLPPDGACNCAVATGVTTNTATDNSESLGPYTISPLNISAYLITLTNESTGSAQSQLAVRQNGTLLGYLPGGSSTLPFAVLIADPTGVTDATAALTTLVNNFRSSGGTIYVPKGTYKISSTVQLAPGPGENGNAISLICPGGYTATTFKWYGANQGVMFAIGDATNYGATTVTDCGFQGSDATHKPIAIGIANFAGDGTPVIINILRNNFGGNLYRGIRGSNTWIGWVKNNHFQGPETDVEWGGGTNVGPVNAYHVNENEFGSGWSGYAILSHPGAASYGNEYTANSIENTNPPFSGGVSISNENLYTFTAGYNEITAQAGVYPYIFNGSYAVIRMSALTCMQVGAGGGSTYITVYGGTRTDSCSTVDSGSYVVKNDSNYNAFYGLTAADISSVTTANVYGGAGGANPQLNVGGALAVSRYSIGTAYNIINGRVDINGVPFTSSTFAGTNPTYPANFGTSAVIPKGMVVFNKSFFSGVGSNPINENYMWVCNANPCNANPLTASEWVRMGELTTKVRAEGTAAPTAGTWAIGDTVINTNPSELGTAGSKYILEGWKCTGAGSPGTWVEMHTLTGN